MIVVVVDELLNHLHPFLDMAAADSPETLLCQFAEPWFDGIEPGTAGRRKVHVEAGMPFEPALHCRMFVGGIVVDDQMQIEVGWRFDVNLLEELQPFLMTMTWHALGNQFALGHLQCGEERGHGNEPCCGE